MAIPVTVLGWLAAIVGIGLASDGPLGFWALALAAAVTLGAWVLIMFLADETGGCADLAVWAALSLLGVPAVLTCMLIPWLYLHIVGERRTVLVTAAEGARVQLIDPHTERHLGSTRCFTSDAPVGARVEAVVDPLGWVGADIGGCDDIGVLWVLPAPDALMLPVALVAGASRLRPRRTGRAAPERDEAGP